MVTLQYATAESFAGLLTGGRDVSSLAHGKQEISRLFDRVLIGAEESFQVMLQAGWHMAVSLPLTEQS